MREAAASMLRIRLAPFCESLTRLFAEPIVIVCGSTALGEEMPWSDIDLVVVADFKEPFSERLKQLTLLNRTGLPLEIVGYTADEFMNMLDRLNAMAIESVEFGMPILPGRCYDELKRKVAELKERGLTKTRCTYLLAEEGPRPAAARPIRDS
jgi:hypothetical protein